MAAEVGWLDGEDEVRRVLREAHKARHNAGREETKRLGREIEQLIEAGALARAVELRDQRQERGDLQMRRKRKREQMEAELEMKKLRAALKRSQRALFGPDCPEALFQQFEAKPTFGEGPVRDLYFEWIGRGLGSGKPRAHALYLKRSTSRTTPWKRGEMGRKIRYIWRLSALEEVEGNIVTNMGDDIQEAVACSKVLEALERIGRPKNGGVYHHLILGLPHQLNAPQRAELLKALTRPLDEMKLPFAAALHRPDKRGDQRNFHAHVLISLRPMERVGDHQWEFSPVKRTWLDTPAGLFLQRKFVARTFNRALAAAGHDARWTAKSRKSRGLSTSGNNKKGPERTRAEYDQQEAEARFKAARKFFAEVNLINRGVRLLDQVGTVLGNASLNLAQLIGDRVAELRDLACQATQQADALKGLSARLDAAMEKAGGRERSFGTSDQMERSGKHEIRIADAELGPDVFKEIREAEHVRSLKKSKKVSVLEAADNVASTAMGDGWPRLIAVHAFDRARQRLLDGEVFAVKESTGQYKLYARSRDLLGEIVAIVATDDGRRYMRLIIDALPQPGADRRGLKVLGLVHKEVAAATAESDRQKGGEVDTALQQMWLDRDGASLG